MKNTGIHRAFIVVVLFGAIAIRGAFADDSLRLPVTRDVWLSGAGREADDNLGGSSRLKLKSIQELSIIDLDVSSLRGRIIKSATLHVHGVGGEILRRVTVSTLAAEFVEGTSPNYATQTGASCFNFRKYPDVPWAFPRSDLTAVMLGQGGSIWHSADASPPDAGGWQTIAVDPSLIAARLAGISGGFVLFDDTGSEWTRDGEKFSLRLFPSRFVHSRESGEKTAPYFTVTLGAADTVPPAAPTDLRADVSDLHSGEAIVSWITPADAGDAGTVGFNVTVDGKPVPRYLIPAAGPNGKRVAMHLRDLDLKPGATAKLSVSAVDGAGNVGSAGSLSFAVSSPDVAPLPGTNAAPFINGGPLPKLGDAEIAIVDALDKVQPVSGQTIPPQPAGYLSANHLWNSREIRLHAARDEFVSFQILVRGEVKGLTAKTEFRGTQPGPTSTFARFDYVQSKSGPVGDPLVPLSDGLTIPDPLQAIAGQKFGSIYCEIYVPHEAPAGQIEGNLLLAAEGKELKIPIRLTVWDFVLPDHLSFIPEMNCYGLPANEMDYYRLAHVNRVVLNRVPYFQNGAIEDGCAPAWDAARKTLDFGAWDKRFAPLLDGSAFADLPRKGVPIECFYLPLEENWPSPMEGNYNGDYWADRAFPPSYRDAFVAASRQFAEHFNQRRWNQTLFQCFFNGKNNFKENGWSRGSSPWLLDEPANFQDYWALKFFGDMFHQGVSQAPAGGAKMLFRCDISRPEWQRDALDDVLNYNVVNGGAFSRYRRIVLDRKRQFGQIVIPYGTTNDPAESNVQAAAWCVDSWTLGGDGVLPWQTIGNANSWKRADATSLFYPGGPVGQKQPIPSIRLKAYLRGEQDVEYLVLLSQLEKQSQEIFGPRVRAALPLASQRKGTGAGEDAGMMAFDSLRPQDLWALRVRVGEAISARHPVARMKLVEFPPLPL
ncbi:MAG TPA: hypothetical protein VH370_09665 [Humisphaera sp.]|nr:hypothetical protein [Humisphaera sp.]